MKTEEFVDTIRLVTKLQNIVDLELANQKELDKGGNEEVINSISKLSCRVTDCYDSLIEYASFGTVEYE